ncbi:MAG: hypothetical protein DCF26_14420 [Burkholderiales bacterium]|nr:MAG: hypothetical protein DCF26_14420 [Burkholderiales bacterium]
MTRGVPEVWARRGTAEDIIRLLRLYVQLDPVARQLLTDSAARYSTDRLAIGQPMLLSTGLSACESLDAPPLLDQPPQHRYAHLLDSVGRQSRTSEEDSLGQTITLVRIFTAGDQGKLLTEAVEALARQKIDPSTAIPQNAVDPNEWLNDLAKKSYPDHSDVARLITLAADFQPDSRGMIFSDGWLEPVLCASQDEYVHGEGIYSGYMHVLGITDDYLGLMPAPSTYFNIQVAQDDFSEFSHGEGWTLDKVAWEAEVRHQCVLRFASFVCEWRSDFFEAVLAA